MSVFEIKIAECEYSRKPVKPWMLTIATSRELCYIEIPSKSLAKLLATALTRLSRQEVETLLKD